MAKLLLLAETEIDVLDFSDVADWLAGVRSQGVQGLESITLWRSLADPKRHIVASLYASAEDSRAALEKLAEDPLIEHLKSLGSVPNVTAAELVCGSGGCMAAPYLSLVSAWLETGFEEQREAEFGETLDALAYCEGFKGALLARSVGTPQLVSMAGWASEQTCRAAMPSQAVHEVRLFEKLQLGG